ncbi:hypothetical protein QBC35DRAFT_510053 [Podospora australis]|uniref:Uncharacterized protein n=1 Tax=Podospora australis TaxID=1536484 RepID=A0AAN6WL80_9PEZI|nr:hypothetical protein QBC35DRAFT_510053 [Podospora australis]
MRCLDLRVLLGAAMSGIFPGLVYVIGTCYPRKERNYWSNGQDPLRTQLAASTVGPVLAPASAVITPKPNASSA